MNAKTTMLAKIPNKVAIAKLLVRTGIAELMLVEAPILVARGALAIPNKSGLARLYLKRKAANRESLVRAAAFAVPAAAAGAGIGLLVRR